MSKQRTDKENNDDATSKGNFLFNPMLNVTVFLDNFCREHLFQILFKITIKFTRIRFEMNYPMTNVFK